MATSPPNDAEPLSQLQAPGLTYRRLRSTSKRYQTSLAWPRCRCRDSAITLVQHIAAPWLPHRACQCSQTITGMWLNCSQVPQPVWPEQAWFPLPYRSTPRHAAACTLLCHCSAACADVALGSLGPATCTPCPRCDGEAPWHATQQRVSCPLGRRNGDFCCSQYLWALYMCVHGWAALYVKLSSRQVEKMKYWLWGPCHPLGTEPAKPHGFEPQAEGPGTCISLAANIWFPRAACL